MFRHRWRRGVPSIHIVDGVGTGHDRASEHLLDHTPLDRPRHHCATGHGAGDDGCGRPVGTVNVSDPTGTRPTSQSADSSAGPRWAWSIIVWISVLAVDLWATMTALSTRGTPIYRCEGPPTPALLFVLVLFVSAYGLLRAYLHGTTGLTTLIVVLIVVAAVLTFGAVVWSLVVRPELPCMD